MLMHVHVLLRGRMKNQDWRLTRCYAAMKHGDAETFITKTIPPLMHSEADDNFASPEKTRTDEFPSFSILSLRVLSSSSSLFSFCYTILSCDSM